MKIVRNSIIPFKGYKLINLFGVLFCREETELNDVDINHESIHTAQMKEMLFLFFYIHYAIEFLLKMFMYPSLHKTYRAISFEREAYAYEEDLDYLSRRKHYKWLQFIINN